VVLYPKEYEINWIDKKGTPLFFRPVKATDERAIQELLYDLPQQDVYTRFFHNLKSFSHKVAMPMAAIDYDDKMAIVAVIGKEEPEGREKIVAIGNYANNPNTRYAEVAFSTHQDWQDRGIGTFLLQYLIRIAKGKNNRRVHGGRFVAQPADDARFFQVRLSDDHAPGHRRLRIKKSTSPANEKKE